MNLMFAPVFRMGSFAHLAFMALGCSTDGETFGRLVETWVDETVTLSQPALTDALVVAGMAAEICALGDDLDWSSMELGDAIPLSDSINSSLGLPVLSELEDYGDGTVQVILSGIVMMDRDESLLRFTTAKVDDELLLDAAFLDARQSAEDQPDGEPFGRLSLQVASGCSPEMSRVRGNAVWTDLEARTHTIGLPSDDAYGLGVGFRSDYPWIPVTGTASWSARVTGQDRNVRTFDAADIVILEGEAGELPSGSWPSIISGADWVSQVSVEINPNR